MSFPGADLIVHEALPFMARQAPPTLEWAPQTTRDQSLRLAHDEIGAWEMAAFYLVCKL